MNFRSIYRATHGTFIGCLPFRLEQVLVTNHFLPCRCSRKEKDGYSWQVRESPRRMILDWRRRVSRGMFLLAPSKRFPCAFHAIQVAKYLSICLTYLASHRQSLDTGAGRDDCSPNNTFIRGQRRKMSGFARARGNGLR